MGAALIGDPEEIPIKGLPTTQHHATGLPWDALVEPATRAARCAADLTDHQLNALLSEVESVAPAADVHVLGVVLSERCQQAPELVADYTKELMARP